MIRIVCNTLALSVLTIVSVQAADPIRVIARPQCPGAIRAYVSRAQRSSCVVDFARRDRWLGIHWRPASWVSCRFAKLNDLDCSTRRARRDFTACGNRWTGSRSVVQSAAEDVTNQFAEPQRDCVQVESVEDIPMRLYEC